MSWQMHNFNSTSNDPSRKNDAIPAADPALIASPRSSPARARLQPALVARACRRPAVVASLNSGVFANYYPVRNCYLPAVVASLRSSPARTCHRPALGPRSSPARARLRPALVARTCRRPAVVAGPHSGRIWRIWFESADVIGLRSSPVLHLLADTSPSPAADR